MTFAVTRFPGGGTVVCRASTVRGPQTCAFCGRAGGLLCDEPVSPVSASPLPDEVLTT